MIAKTTIGADFSGALNYGAGISVKGKIIEGKSELLLTHNLLSQSPNEMAREMNSEAAFSKCKSPVWHTSLSWPPEEKPSKEEMIKSANLYCKKIGADTDKHQIVVYRHFDQEHDHIHIYINRVSEGKAIETSHNYAQNVRVCKEISEELGFKAIPKLKDGKLRKVTDFQKEAQAKINKVIKSELKKNCSSIDDLQKVLESNGISCKFKIEGGRLKSSSYQYQGVNIKGQDVGFTSKKLNEVLGENKNRFKAMTKENNRGLSI